MRRDEEHPYVGDIRASRTCDDEAACRLQKRKHVTPGHGSGGVETARRDPRGDVGIHEPTSGVRGAVFTIGANTREDKTFGPRLTLSGHVGECRRNRLLVPASDAMVDRESHDSLAPFEDSTRSTICGNFPSERRPFAGEPSTDIIGSFGGVRLRMTDRHIVAELPRGLGCGIDSRRVASEKHMIDSAATGRRP